MNSSVFFYTPAIEIIQEYSKIFVELIEKRLFLKEKILIFQCFGKNDLSKCIANFRGDRSKCFKCQSGLYELKKKYNNNKNVEFISYLNKTKINYNIKTYDDLKKIMYDGINIGIGVHSCLITLTKDHNYSIKKYHHLINDQLRSCVLKIDNLNLIKDKIKSVFVFNGRVSHYKVPIDFSIKNNKDFYVFEVVYTMESSYQHDGHCENQNLM